MINKLIEFIRSTAFIIGFLFAVAAAYYLSFWSYFDIDVFQFVAVTDIIKGIAYPLRFAEIGILSAFFFIILIYTAIGLKKGGRGAFIILAFVAVPTIVILLVFKFILTSTLVGVSLSVLSTMTLIVIYLLVDDVHSTDIAEAKKNKEEIDEEHPASECLKFIVIFTLIFLPINAIVAGQVDARDIHDGKRFNYTMREDLPKDKIAIRYDYLIFLGAVSEKYIFINKNENERFIIDKEELQTLRVSHFDIKNKASVNQLSINLLAQSQNLKK